ncbi:HupE/UreJ protein [Methylocella silvestris BL2]|uniref:HupE/UreJ protein n=1 Tax=Methylocella silvestris (strain DSM 15510 / CIP 108128 / LMG 27833 / NCIMB 13906 / BL2) TaxID=395965 RepID=B8EJD7_METSB|nr:HupE/UreJ family protein [Methylocella silvestris]ACK52629.1 HupE/UreJ protein [Methylocella silvestris BL2]
MKPTLKLALLALALAGLPISADAHVGLGDAHGFMHGFSHPLGGLDHVLAMVAVGMFAAYLGGRALWLTPAAFFLMMGVGGALGLAGVALPFVEIGIAASVIVLGLAVALQWSLPTVAAMALVGFFAIFHGHAHGAEMPADVSGLDYALGFMLATALLHVAGIGIGLGVGRIGAQTSRLAFRASGGLMALAGVGLLTGYL